MSRKITPEIHTPHKINLYNALPYSMCGSFYISSQIFGHNSATFALTVSYDLPFDSLFVTLCKGVERLRI